MPWTVEIEPQPATDGASASAPTTAPHGLVHAATPSLLPGDTVGRYVVLARLGSGGMGVVYAAHDPELDRKVALKLLRGDRYPSPGDNRRLVREAQALARLAHPNVVGVHDVGTHGAQVWLALEFVAGKTLRAWLGERRRSWREVVAVIVAAGQGLAAAHARGLLHRDVKPDNIMVGDDGRVRVMDFGLARLAAGDVDSGPEASPGAGPLTTSPTARDLRIGTPAYTPPECWLGYEADARGDQFSLCVTLWEALHGERPFAGDTRDALEAAITSGRRRPPPPGARVPTWLRLACERGLSLEPDQRWPDVQALLDALSRGHARAGRRRLAVVLGLVGLVLAGAVLLRHADLTRRQAACERAGREIADVWGPQAQARLAASLRASGAAGVEVTLQRLVPRLDAWAAAWSAERAAACVASDVTGERPPALGEQARECLDEQRDALVGVFAVLTGPDPRAVHHALPAVAELPPPAACLDVRALERRPPPPADPARRELLAALGREHRQLRGRITAGASAQALADAEALLARIAPASAPGLLAAVHATLGDLAEITGEYARAEQAYVRAYLDAGALRDDELAAHAAIRLVTLVGVEADRRAEGETWARSAEMLVRRLGEEDGPLGVALLAARARLAVRAAAFDDAEQGYRAVLERRERDLGPEHPATLEALAGLGEVLDLRGQVGDAVALAERLLALRERALGPEHPQVAAASHNLGLLWLKQDEHAAAIAAIERAAAIWSSAFGPESADVARALHTLAVAQKDASDLEAARANLERALAIRERVLGPDHRLVGQTLNALAIDDRRRGDYDAAERRYVRVMAIWERALGPEHPDVAAVGNNLAELHRSRGRLDEARRLHERVLAIRERVLGPDHPQVADSLNNLGELRRAAGDLDLARSLHQRALDIRERTYGPEHGAVAVSLHNLGDVALARGALDEAESYYQQALTLFEARRGPKHLHVSYPLVGLGQLALLRDRPDEAVAALSRALAVREDSGAAPGDRAEARFVLARALRARGDRAAARAAGARALEEAREAARAELSAEITAWLARR